MYDLRTLAKLNLAALQSSRERAAKEEAQRRHNATARTLQEIMLEAGECEGCEHRAKCFPDPEPDTPNTAP